MVVRAFSFSPYRGLFGTLTLSIVFSLGARLVSAQASDPDLNNDGTVNILDISIVSSCFGQDPLTNTECIVADVDADGDIDFDDLSFVSGAFGQTGFPPGDTTPPLVIVPGDITLTTTDSSGIPATDPAIVSFLGGANAFDDVDGPIAPSNDAPAVFPLGTTVVNFSATDAAGNTGSAQARVTIEQTGGDDVTPPDLLILSPLGGSLVVQGQPEIQLSYSDASGVDTTTLSLQANGQPLNADCQLGGTSGSCTPSSLLPEGPVTLAASIADLVGNVAQTSIEVNVDTLPVEVEILDPADGLITMADTVEVQGTVGGDVDGVEVNGVAASVTGGSFTASIPLREGKNMLVAVATKASGKTGTDSVDVTRDIVAPIVRISTPRDAFVSINPVVTVTGQVNDIVNGATNAVVKVNGIEATVAGNAFMAIDIPLVRGPNLIEATATDAVGNVGTHSVTVLLQQAVGARMGLRSGNGQAGFILETLAESLVAEVTDNLGNPVAGRVVRFEVTRSSGTLQLGPGEAPARELQVPTDGSGRASVLFTLGETAGEGNNRVRATSVGVAGEVEFCASALTAPADKILMVSGDNQRGVTNHPLASPLEALVVDIEGNPIAGVDVRFEVLKGGGNIDGASSFVRVTGTDGIARAVLTLGPDAGINNNAVSATFAGLVGLPATFVSSGLNPGNPADTRFRGVVLDNGQTPIPNALVEIPGTLVSARTDAEGQFLLENVPVGHILLHIDPTESPRPETFPPLEFETVTIAGQTNILGQPILLPALDTEGSQIVGGDQDVTLSMKGVAGLTLTVFANSVTCPDGSSECRVTISQVHLDKVPMPPPSGTIFMPPAWTIQPAGVQFDPPARITIPNDGLPPGRVIDIFQFDHTLNQFINIGKGTVSEDASIIVSDPGFGITRAGWGGCGQPQPPTTCTLDCGPCKRPNAACTACEKDPEIEAICMSAEARGMCGSPCEGVDTTGMTLGGCWSHEIGGVEHCYWDYMGPGAPNGGHPMLCCDSTPHCNMPGGMRAWDGGAPGSYQCTQIVPAGGNVGGATCNPAQCPSFGPI